MDNTQNQLPFNKVDLMSTKNIDMKKRRVVNASPSVDNNDYVIKSELAKLSQVFTDLINAIGSPNTLIVRLPDGTIQIKNTMTNKGINLKPNGSGFVLISSNTNIVPAPYADTMLQIVNRDGHHDRVAIVAYGGIPLVDIQQANGTAAAPTATLINNLIGQISFQGYNGSAFGAAAIIRAVAAENWTSSANGIDLIIFTAQKGTGGSTEAARFFASGGLSVGSTFDPGQGGVNAATKYYIGGTPGATVNVANANLTIQGGIITAASSGFSGFTTQQNMIGARVIGGVYQNTSGHAIFVSVTFQNNSVVQTYTAKTDSFNPPVQTVVQQAVTTTGASFNISFWVLNSSYFQVTASGGTTTLIVWMEWS